MRAQFGIAPQIIDPADWSLSVTASGGSLSAIANIYVYVQLTNRRGKNLHSAPKNIAISANDALVVTLNVSIVREGEDPWWVIISAETVNDNLQAVQIAEVEYKSRSDQQATLSLPLDVTFTLDEQIETTNLAVTTAANLPSNPLNGTIRTIDDQGGDIVYYNEILALWEPYYFSTIFTYQDNTENLEGSDQGLGTDILIPALPFDSQVSQITTVPVRYALINDNPEGNGANLQNQIELIVFINGQAVNADNLFVGSIYSDIINFQLIGYYRISNRSIDQGVTGTFVTQQWNSANNQLRLEDPLPPGWAAIYDIWLDADSSVFALTGHQPGDVLSFAFVYRGKVGRFVPELAAIFGAFVVSGEEGKLKLLPNRLTTGSAIVARFFIEQEVDDIGVLNTIQIDTGDQLLIINGATGGSYRTAIAPATLSSSEGILASFSTEPGFTNPSEVSDLVTLNSPGGYAVTLNHPILPNNKAQIREDYPDSVVAGETNADWVNPSLRLYAIYNGTTIYQKDDLIVAGSSPAQVEQVTNFSGWTIVTVIPDRDNTIPNGTTYGLFDPIKIDPVAEIAGTLPVGTYQFVFRYEYPAGNLQLTRINHRVAGAIKRLGQTFEDTLSTEQLFRDEVLTIETARELPTSDRIQNTVWQIGDLGNALYILKLDLNLADDGRNVIRFNSGPGGFIPLNELGIKIIDQDGSTLDRYSTIKIANPLVATVDTITRSIQLSVNQDLLNTPVVEINLLDTGLEFLSDTAGDLLTW